VGDQDAVAQQLGQLPEHELRGGRPVDHRLGDPGEPLDRARQRRADPHQRLPAIVQLAAAHQYRADLGELTPVACAAVGLGVDDEELGGAQRTVQQVHHRMLTGSEDGLHGALHSGLPEAAT